MKSRDAVGKKIVKVLNRQSSRDDTGDRFWYVAGLVLEDGSLLVPRTIETGYGYATAFDVYKSGQWDPAAY